MKIKGWKRLQSYENSRIKYYWERENYAISLEVFHLLTGDYAVILTEFTGCGDFEKRHRIGKGAYDTQSEAYKVAVAWMKNKSW
jgi:hypothetical protein